MEIEQLCVAFKKEGKQLNRVVHHASKMNKVFNDTERRQLIRLNKCLTDLMSMLRSDIDKGSIMTVKRMIQAFVSEATGVLQMIEQKNNPGKPVQEGFFDKFKKKNGSSKANFDHGYLIIDDDPEIKLFLTDDEEISAGHNTDKWYDSSKITPKEYLIAERESTDSSEWCAMIGLLKDSGELAIVLRGSDEDVRLYPLKTDSMSEVKEMFKSGKHISKDYSVQEGFFDKFKKKKKTLDEYVDEFERQCDCKLRDEIRQFLTTPSKELDSIWCSNNRGIEGTKLYICATYDAKSLDDKISIGLYEDHKLITIMLVTDYSNDSETGDTTVLSISNDDGAIYETTDETGRNYRNYGKIADSLDDLKSKLEKYKY